MNSQSEKLAADIRSALGSLNNNAEPVVVLVRQLVDRVEQAEARVAELEEAVADTAIACQRSLDPDWVPDWVQDALIPLSKQCRALLGDDPDEYESSWILRKQAEAVEEAIVYALRAVGNVDPFEVDIHKFANDYAQRLRQQADDIEMGGE